MSIKVMADFLYEYYFGLIQKVCRGRSCTCKSVSLVSLQAFTPVNSGVTLECQALRAEAVKGLEELAEAV
jgi:predicted N-formylglutamate amidohydrolase